MSGETEASISAWTVDSLHSHVDKRIADQDRHYDQRFESQEKAIVVAMTAYGQAVSLAAEKTASEIMAIQKHYDAILLEKDLRHEQRFEASQTALTVALEERDKAISVALKENDRAIQSALNDVKKFYDTVLAERDQRYDQRFDAQEKAVVVALASVDKEFHEHINQVRQETTVALESADKAIVKSESATEKRFECVSADTPILCADLTWRPAGDLLVGDELISFDEESPNRRGRRFKRATVTDNSLERDTLFLVTTPLGAVRCNANHPWLVRRHEWKWVKTIDILPGEEVMHAVDTWQVDRSWEAGWLAGMFDGEGCLSLMKNKRCQLSLSQRESATSDKIALSLKERLGRDALAYRYEPGTSSTPNNTQPFFHFLICGRPDVMKVLGSVRPPRLLAKADGVWEGAALGGSGRSTLVTSIESVGSGVIAQLSTSTGTYIANGFAMHNSVNEFRAQQADIIQTFARKDEMNANVKGLTEKIEGCITQTNQLAATTLPRNEYDRAHIDLADKVVAVDKSLNEKLEVLIKTIDQRLTQLQAQLSSIEAVTR